MKLLGRGPKGPFHSDTAGNLLPEYRAHADSGLDSDICGWRVVGELCSHHKCHHHLFPWFSNLCGVQTMKVVVPRNTIVVCIRLTHFSAHSGDHFTLLK